MKPEYSADILGEHATIWLSNLSDETLLQIYDDLRLGWIRKQIPLDDDLNEIEARVECVMWSLRRALLEGNGMEERVYTGDVQDDGEGWHHLLMDVQDCKVLTADELIKWCMQIIDVTKMRLLGGPFVAHGEDPPGPTVVAIMQESHISAHAIPDWNRVYADVFSCRPFNPTIVRRITQKLFEAETVNLKYIRR